MYVAQTIHKNFGREYQKDIGVVIIVAGINMRTWSTENRTPDSHFFRRSVYSVKSVRCSRAISAVPSYRKAVHVCCVCVCVLGGVRVCVCVCVGGGGGGGGGGVCACI